MVSHLSHAFCAGLTIPLTDHDVHQAYLCANTPCIKVCSPQVVYTDNAITATYDYHSTSVNLADGGSATTEATTVTASPFTKTYVFKTERTPLRTGVMIVGWGGNNGSTLTAALLAAKEKVAWHTARGVRTPNFFGSITQSSTVRLGQSKDGDDVFVPFSALLPMVAPTDLVLGGWDVSSLPLGDAMRRAAVLDYDLQRQLCEKMNALKPLPSIYVPDFIAANQGERADNVLHGTLAEQLSVIRGNIREFKAQHGLNKVIVLWSATTERFSEIIQGVHDTADNLLTALQAGHPEIAPSTMFCMAACLEGCSYINGSPQNTFVPGVIELAKACGVFIGGDDFKSGQTKLKSVLVDFLVSSGIKPTAIVSYNHLGNNDGKNLSAPPQFKSKEISKSNVVDDMVASNSILYAPGEKPDHCVVIKYVPYVGDSKRALDEYTSEICMGGTNTLVIHNTCEDSLLAAPLMLDLVILCELFERMSVKELGAPEFERLHPVLSPLSFLLKAPLVPAGTPVVNALFKQRDALINVMRAAVGLPAESHMLLEHRLASAGEIKLATRASGAC